MRFDFRHHLHHLVFRRGEDLVVLFCIFYEIRNIQKSVLFQSNIHKGGLHPGKHLGHPPFVDVSQYSPTTVALDVQFRNLIVFQDCYLGLERGAIHYHLFDHQLLLTNAEGA